MSPTLCGQTGTIAAFGLLAFLPSAEVPAQEVQEVQRTENHRPVLSDEDGWRIGTDPLFEAGNADEPGGPDFYQVRGILRLSNGATVISNSGNNDLVYLGPSGEVTAIAGGWGDGPGEFRAMGSLGIFRGDSVFVVDYVHQSVSLFDDTGQFGRLIGFGPLVPYGYFPQGALSDGRFIFASDAGLTGGPGADSTALLVVDLDRAVIDTIGRFPKSFSGNPPGTLAHGPLSVFIVGERYFYWGYGDRFEFHQFDQTGRLVGILSKEWQPYRISDRAWRRSGEARIESLRRIRVSDMETLIRRARQEQARINHAETLPAFGRAFVDSEDNLWVKEYPLIGVREASWHVFDEGGRWLTQLDPPERFQVFAAGGDWIAGVFLDELDAEVVQVLPLVKR